MLDNQLLFTVTDLKQYVYCPRVIYYEQCLPHIRPRTYKMDAGRDAHEDERKRAARRTLKQYNLPAGERVFDKQLTSLSLHLTGIVDEVVYAGDGLIFPVDYKLAKRVGANHRLQLVAYALLLESIEDCSVDYGYVYLIPHKKMHQITITPKLRQSVHDILDSLLRMVSDETQPDPVQNIRQCMNCEFRRFCNDTL